MASLCTRVRELRTARKWSLRELAAMASVPLSTVVRWDASQVSTFDADVLDKLARAFSLDEPGYLIHRCRPHEVSPKSGGSKRRADKSR